MPFRVFVVGCGSISREELKPLCARSDVEIVALVDIREENARARRDEFNLTRAQVHTDLEMALTEHRPDVVVDCTIPAAHREVVLAAFRHGCHVLGQKPLADTLEHAREMVAAGQASGKSYGIIQTARFSAQNQGLRDFLRARPFGRLTALDFRFFLGMHFPEGDFRNTMEHVLLIDMAIHQFDAMRMITGHEPVSVFCKEWNPAGSWYAHGASAAAIFSMSDGLQANYHGSWCAEGVQGSEWRVFGERGSLSTKGPEGPIAKRVLRTEGFRSTCEDLEVPIPDLAPEARAHHGAVNDFFDSLRDGRQPDSPAADNIRSLAMVYGAIQSAREGREVKIV